MYLLKSKDEVLHVFMDFHKMVETKFGRKIKALRSDNGGKYVSKKFQSYLSDNGIESYALCAYDLYKAKWSG